MRSRWAAILVAALIVVLLGAGAMVGYRYIQQRQAIPAPTSSLISAGMLTSTITATTALPLPTPLPEGAVVIPDTTKVLTGTTTQNLASISSDGSLFTFSESTSQLESLSQGDVIVGCVSDKAPDGFLRKVQSVSAEGGLVVVQTGPARLEDAIQTGSLSLSRELKPDDVRAGWKRPGVALASLVPMSAQGGWMVTLADVVLFDLDGKSSTTEDQIRANGSIAFEPSLDFDLKIAWFQLEELTLVVRATETVDIRVSGNVQLANVNEEVQVAFFPLNAIPLSIGPVPVVLTPILNVSVGLDGTAHVGFLTGVTQRASVAAGVQYVDDKWNPIRTFDNSFDFVPPALTGSLQVEAYGSIQLAVLIYGVGGPYASLNGYFGLDADLQRTPPWKLYGGLRCIVGVRAEILGYKLGDYQATVLDSSTPIGEGGLPVTDTPTPTATATPTPSGTPTSTPIPTTRPACDREPEGEFAALWQTYRQELGCPLTGSPVPVQDAEQTFDYGRMLWRADKLTIYVVYDKGSMDGIYWMYPDTWQEGDPVYSCAATPPASRVQPWRGFGKVWCALGGGSSAVIGWGLALEQGFVPGNGDPLVQDFQAGTIFRDSAGTANRQVYIFFADTNGFVHVGY
jgi:hypothetical protein